MNVDLTFRADARRDAAELTDRLMQTGLDVNRSPRSDGSFVVYAMGVITEDDADAYVTTVTQGLTGVTVIGGL